MVILITYDAILPILKKPKNIVETPTADVFRLGEFVSVRHEAANLVHEEKPPESGS
jgi:hypothetical protein